MAFPYNRIAEVRKLKGLSQQELADLVGAHSVTVSNLERGKLPLTYEWLERFAAALKTDLGELIGEEPKPRVYVEGWIDDEAFFSFPGSTSVAVDVELGVVPVVSAAWYVIMGDKLYPAFTNGDLIRLVLIDHENLEAVHSCFGRLVILHTKSSSAEISLGYLAPGSSAGKVTLNPIGRPPLVDRSIRSLRLVDRCFYKPKLPRLLGDTVEHTLDELRDAEFEK
jgi:transcriptional regulator with XRE-family HTH domain